MQSIKVTILGRQYPLKIPDDEVETMQHIARFVDEKLRLYRQEFSKQPETTIMVLACLSVAEELFETRERLQNRPDTRRLTDSIARSLEDLLEEAS